MTRSKWFQLRPRGGRGCMGKGYSGALAAALGACLCLAGCGDDEGTTGGTTSTGGTGTTSGNGTTGSDGGTTGSDGGTTGSDGGVTGMGTTGTAQGSSEVMTQSGPIAGEMVDEGGTAVHVFRGVPYAAPPVGELRWKPPQPVEPWTEVRDATQWGGRSPQPSSMLIENGEITEDCLNLNVLTPSLEEASGLPVMVFFHGGGLSIGTGNSPTYSHTALPATENVVVVTVNQRLGPIGYLSHPALAAESEHDASGNYGTLDQIAALEWVRDNITAFGGDPNNVTIFGESGGGTKVLSCLGSPLCKGLFHRAIVQSGSRSAAEGAVTARETAEQMGVALASQLGIAADDPEALQKLRAFSWEEVLEASSAMEVGYMANIAIDGWVFPKSIHEALLAGEQADVPLIVGANKGEAAMLMGDVPELAANMQSVSSNAYVYMFSYVPPGWQADNCYAFHGLELAYVFGHLPGLMSPTMIFLGMNAGCPTTMDPAPSDVDQQVANNTMKMWAQFARTGDPSVPDLIEWPAYTAEGDQYLEIGAELSVGTGVASAGADAPGIGGTLTE